MNQTSDTYLEPQPPIGERQNLIERIFSAFDNQRIEYCLLRGANELVGSEGYLEIDLLLRANQIPQFSETVKRLGFVEWPSWGHAPHRFFLIFEGDRGDWVKLDVVTELMYGRPIRRFRVDLVDACLDQRRNDRVYVLSPLHEFVTLFLHGLLDKGQLRDAHRQRLIELLDIIKGHENSNAKSLLEKYVSPVFSWETIQQAVRGNDWDALLKKQKKLALRFFVQQPLSSQWRVVRATGMRRLRGLGFALFRRGISVALLAPDGAGKSTLSAALVQDRILKARGVYMGGNLAASTFTLPTTRFLHQKVKAKNGSADSNLKANLILKGLSFCSKLAEQWLRAGSAHYHLLRGRFVVFDRYIFDSWVNPKPRTLLKRVRRILFEAILPTPDLVILLDAPGKMLYERKGEHTPEWLEEQRQRYLQLRARIPNLRIVDATHDAEMVRREAIALIWKQYGIKVNLTHGN